MNDYSGVDWHEYETYCDALEAGEIHVTNRPEDSIILQSMWESLIKPGRWVKVLANIPSRDVPETYEHESL
jgi:hypothetical protein